MPRKTTVVGWRNGVEEVLSAPDGRERRWRSLTISQDVDKSANTETSLKPGKQLRAVHRPQAHWAETAAYGEQIAPTAPLWRI